MNKAIVIGAPHYNTLGLIRSLGIKGLAPSLYLISKNRKTNVMKSKFISETLYFDTEEDAVIYLINNKPQKKAVLFASGDPTSACLDKHYEELKNNYSLFNIQGHMIQYMNKEIMCSIAKQIGLNVPQHVVYRAGEKLPVDVHYPCITKAISSIDGDKSNTTICQTQEELETFLSTPNLCSTIQIERYIDKEIEFQFIGVSLNKGEFIIIPGHSHIDRPNGIQNDFYFKYIENDSTFDDTLRKANLFIKKIGYSGLFSIEFLRGKDGKDYFLEMNFRNDGCGICVTDAGYNLPFFWYQYSINNDIKKELENAKFKSVIYCPEVNHALQCAYGELSIMEFVKNIFSAESFTHYYKGDSSRFYWLWFCYYAFKQVIIKRMLIKIGIFKAPKESI